MFFSLNGNWKLNHVPFEADISHMLQEDYVPEGWLTAKVPEMVHGTLQRLGYIQGHVYSKDPETERWIEESDWVYYKEFFVPEELDGKKVQLCCKGLDTFCDVYLNGVLLGYGNNMFRSFRAEIGSVLKRGERNVLVIRFYSPVKYVEEMDQKGIFSITTSERIFARKAQMNYSWDFCGRTVTTGIWKDVGIEIQNDAVIDCYHIYTKDLKEDSAVIGLETELNLLEGNIPEDYQVQIRLSKEGKEVFAQTCSYKEAQKLEFTVEQPKLWWPRPYGAAELYDLELNLLRDGECIDSKKQKFGIRTVEVAQEYKEDGKSFQFVINGKKLFVRGANWVPMRMIYSEIRDEHYDLFLEYAARGRISMLRIWGGGIYENDRFFEKCDELGIMVWSDFMFSCGIYPQNEEFLENVKQEAIEVVKAYRNWTSIVIWAGDNEIGQAYGWAGRDYEFRKDKIGNELLKEICEELDPQRLYITTSPCSPDENFKGGDNPSSPYQGDQHIYIMKADPGKNEWRDYGKEYYKRILGIRPRFMSEFGFISMPEKDTYYRYNFKRETLKNTSEMIAHFPTCEKYFESKEYEKLIYYVQLFNSLALKYWIEYFRSLKGICEGTLYWKFNDPIADCPPQYLFPSHMSTVDMYANPKMTYYYTRRAYADFLVSFVESEEGLKVWAVNEEMTEKKGQLVIEELDFDGNVYWTRTAECCAAADCATLLDTLELKKQPEEIRYTRYLKASFQAEDGVYENRYFYADIIECDKLQMEQAQLKITEIAQDENGDIILRLKTDVFAHNVRMNILDSHADYSDNYFDLEAGAEKEIRIQFLPMQKESVMEDHMLYIEAENVKRFAYPLYQLLK